MAQAAPTVKRVLLELGGKSVQLYLDDAVERAPMGCATRVRRPLRAGVRRPDPHARPRGAQGRGAREGGGRRRHAEGRRPDRRRHDGRSADLRRPARALRAVRRRGRRRRRHGGLPAARGPEGLDRGYYFEPTVLDVPDNSNPAAQDEIFGPVICVIGYRDVDHAVEIANDSVYGLAGQVFGGNLAEAVERRRADPRRRGVGERRLHRRVRVVGRPQAERHRPRARRRRHPRVPAGQAPRGRQPVSASAPSVPVFDGVRVVEFAQFVFVPACGALLADWGADVIKIEHPVTGDGYRGLVSQGILQVSAERREPVDGDAQPRQAEHRPRRRVAGGPRPVAPPRRDGRRVPHQLPAVDAREAAARRRRPARRQPEDHLRAWARPRRARARRRPARLRRHRLLGARRARRDAHAAVTRATHQPAGWVRRPQRRACNSPSASPARCSGASAPASRRSSTCRCSRRRCGPWRPTCCRACRATSPPRPSRARRRGCRPTRCVNTYATKDGRFLSLLLLQPDRHWHDFARAIDRADLLDDPRFATGAAILAAPGRDGRHPRAAVRDADPRRVARRVLGRAVPVGAVLEDPRGDRGPAGRRERLHRRDRARRRQLPHTDRSGAVRRAAVEPAPRVPSTPSTPSWCSSSSGSTGTRS